MAEDELIPENVEDTIDRSLDQPTRSQRASTARKTQPSYKILPGSKIPVAKAYGKTWKGRRDLAAQVQSEVSAAWQEAIRYYENDQSAHRDGDARHQSTSQGRASQLNDRITETENIVFANVTTMVPALYSRNPSAEFTAVQESDDVKRMATLIERTVNTLGSMKAAPGFNMKPKAKRCVITALLTNRSWVHVNWTFKTDSSDQALEDIRSLAERLAKAKDTKKIKEIEGELQALEESVEVLQPEGPKVRVLSPFEVLIDPAAQEIDLSDALWAMHCEYIPTNFLLARYAKRVKDSNQFRSIYKPTHIMKMGIGDEQGHDKDDYQLLDPKDQANNFGFDSEEEFNRFAMTKVWYVWDKITRRVFMYHDNDWTWPIWVWDDPLHLDTFFPYFPLTFFDSPSGPTTKGEVSYYLDQQDAINEITDEKRRTRLWARRNVFYNSNLIDREDVEAVLNGNDGTARGLNLPEGMKLTDAIGTIPPPSLQFAELFNKEEYYQASQRLSSVGDVLQGAQFKTNTNSSAVKANVAATNMRVDEKSDQIEDWIGQVYWAVAQMCLQFMSPELAQSILGPHAEEWRTFSADEIKQNFNMNVVGGSSKKPTSQAKKEEALELGQVLGQFVNAAPGPVLKVMLEVMQEAFDEINLKEEDWDAIIQAVNQQQAGPTGASSGASSPEQQATPNQQGGSLNEQQINQLLETLPPEAKQQIVAQIQQGVPPEQALQPYMQ